MISEGIKRKMERGKIKGKRWGHEVIGKIEAVMGGKVEEVCGEGMGGIRRGKEKYRRVGGDSPRTKSVQKGHSSEPSGVYAFIDERKERAYIGSSKNISRRMREYENKTIVNNKLLEEVNERNWEGFRIIVVLKEDDKEKRVRKEYEIIGRVNNLEGVELYNVFINKEDQEKYGERIRLVRGRRVSDETRERMGRPGAGKRQKGYWFKGGVGNKNARRIRVIDMETGETKEKTRKEVVEELGGDGIWGNESIE